VKQFLSEILVRTQGEGFVDITDQIKDWIEEEEITQGILVINCKHTSCSLIINENADPRVLKDLSCYMRAIVPETGFKSILNNERMQNYLHSEEGPDDMPAHIRTALTSNNLTVSIKNSKLDLGTWQAIYVWEHRYSGSLRNISLHSIGDAKRTKTSEFLTDFNSILAKTNASKINKIILDKKKKMNLSNEDSSEIAIDLLIDRIHDLIIGKD